MGISRKNATRIPYGRYTYLLGMPASEQPPVLKVATKFSNREPADISITKEELEGFASVYVRIYQVPEKTRERLKRWKRAHIRLVMSWAMPFWNSRADDVRLGITPREAGIPPAARNIGLVGASTGGDGGRSDGWAEKSGWGKDKASSTSSAASSSRENLGGRFGYKSQPQQRPRTGDAALNKKFIKRSYNTKATSPEAMKEHSGDSDGTVDYGEDHLKIKEDPDAMVRDFQQPKGVSLFDAP